LSNVSLNRVTKAFGATEVVHGIDLEVANGEFVVLVGPSGCGKSTTLRMIAGLEEITAGVISIGGRIVNRMEPRERNIAMVFQNYAIYPHMTVHRNIAFGLKTSKLSRADKDANVREAARILDLTELLERKPSALSGGQRQRVAIGRAMVRDPAVFLFDEPLSNLDAQLRAQMRLEIKKLHQSMGTTIVFVTHDQVEAMTLADRIVIMRDGHILQVGTPTEVYHNPRDMFVARFIGSPSMNMLEGHAATRNRRPALELDGVGKVALPKLDGPLPASGKAVLGIRPSDLIVCDEPAGRDGTVLKATVSVVEPLGHEALVYADVGGHEVIATAPGRKPPEVGDAVTMRMATENIHVFDPATERALA
jgi:multiple sugar transport system ATP-binding protein